MGITSKDECVKGEYMGDTVFFIKDGSIRQKLPPESITYTVAEARILSKCGQTTKTMVHQMKQITPAVVTEVIQHE